MTEPMMIDDIDNMNDEDIDDEFKDSDDEADINKSPNMQVLNQVEDVRYTQLQTVCCIHTDVDLQKIATLLEYSVQLLDDIKNNKTTPDLATNFVETIKEMSGELARQIHLVSQLPTLPFESNSYSSTERLNAIVARSKLIEAQLQQQQQQQDKQQGFI